jgi:hypothetical protein
MVAAQHALEITMPLDVRRDDRGEPLLTRRSFIIIGALACRAQTKISPARDCGPGQVKGGNAQGGLLDIGVFGASEKARQTRTSYSRQLNNGTQSERSLVAAEPVGA